VASRAVKIDPGLARSYEEAFSPEAVGRQCRLEQYRKVRVRPLQISGEFVAYASPDSTYAVTKHFMDQAEESILVGIYDFTAGYMKELLLRAMGRGVKVALMLDIDSDGEQELFDELKEYGCECVAAPSCASDYVHYFPSSHEKVIVVDGTWTLVQSGNYSPNSIPANEQDGGDRDEFEFGNRDMGVAVESKRLADFFTDLLRRDMQLERDGEAGEAAPAEGPLAELELLEAAPKEPPVKLFPSKRFRPGRAIKVTPVLSPDNYMAVIPDFLASATRSIYIEQQYIRWKQPNVQRLLAAVGRAREENPDLDVRVVLARPYSRGRRFAKDAQDIEALSEFGLEMGRHVRILNPRHFVHCHNKLIVVDNQAVLVSSQNWSDFAITKNREAGLLLEHPEMARYYATIFKTDWDSGLRTLDEEAMAPELYPPEALNSGRRLVRLSWGDYAEV
jgi:phosphatidylserine/phosphatidylglycerophosphate/cardiolipin synthase-like enzyme